MEGVFKILVLMLLITLQDSSAKLEARKVLHIPEKIIGGVIDIVQNHNRNKPVPTATVSQAQVQAQAGYVQGTQQYTPWNSAAGQVYGGYGSYGSYQHGSYPMVSGLQNVQTVQPNQVSGQIQTQSQHQNPQSQMGQFQVPNALDNQNQFPSGHPNVNQQMQVQNQGFQGSNQMQNQFQNGGQGTNQQAQIQIQNHQGVLQNPIHQTPVFTGQQYGQINTPNQHPQYVSNTQNSFAGTSNPGNQVGYYDVQNNQNGFFAGQSNQNTQFVAQNTQTGSYGGQSNQYTPLVGTYPSSSFVSQQPNNQYVGQNVNPQYVGQNQPVGVYQPGNAPVSGGSGFQTTGGHNSGSNGPTCVCQAWTKPQPGEQITGKSEEEITEKPES